MSLKNLEELTLTECLLCCRCCPAFLYRLSWIVLYIDYFIYVWLFNKLL